MCVCVFCFYIILGKIFSIQENYRCERVEKGGEEKECGGSKGYIYIYMYIDSCCFVSPNIKRIKQK